MPPGGSLKVRLSISSFVAKPLGQALEIDHVLTESLGHRNRDLRGLVCFSLACFSIPHSAGSAPWTWPGAPSARTNPFLFADKRFLVRDVLAAFLRQPLLLLRQPIGCNCPRRNALAAVELEDPGGDIVEE